MQIESTALIGAGKSVLNLYENQQILKTTEVMDVREYLQEREQGPLKSSESNIGRKIDIYV